MNSCSADLYALHETPWLILLGDHHFNERFTSDSDSIVPSTPAPQPMPPQYLWTTCSLRDLIWEIIWEELQKVSTLITGTPVASVAQAVPDETRQVFSVVGSRQRMKTLSTNRSRHPLQIVDCYVSAVGFLAILLGIDGTTMSPAARFAHGMMVSATGGLHGT